MDRVNDNGHMWVRD